MAQQGKARPVRPVIERLLEKVVKRPSGCWLYTGQTNAKGYGRIKHQGRTVRAHRVAYEVLVGPIPDGLTLDHTCRVRNCINPQHLEPVTAQENTRRRVPARANSFCKAKTHCPAGHAYDTANTYRNKQGSRVCRACRRASQRAYEARKKARAS